MDDKQTWYSGFGNLPFDVPTKEDLKGGDPREKVEVVYSGWNFRMFDMHDAKDVKAYEDLRSRLIDMVRLSKGKIAKDCAQLLATKTGQKLYYILEWAEFDAHIVTAKDLIKENDEKVSDKS